MTKKVKKKKNLSDIDWHSHKKPNKEVMVEVMGVTKSYGKKEVLHGIDLKIHKGERVAIIGPNGAGKSTLTEIIAGIKEATSGNIKYSFGNNKADISRNIGIQFQESTYPMFVRVEAIVKFFIEAAGLKIDNEKLNELLVLFNLDKIYNQMAEGLSGGQKQRLNILLAVIHKPQLLLLDEVGTGLDVETRTNVKRFIKDFLDKAQATSIIVSHNTDEVMSLADRIIVINDGRIYEDQMLTDILKKHKTFDNYIDNLFLVKFRDEKREKEVKKLENKNFKRKGVSA